MVRPTRETIKGPYRYEQDGPDAFYPIFSSHTYNIQDRTYTGVQTPGYRDLKKRKRLPENPYSSSRQTCSAGSVFNTKTRAGYTVRSLVVHHTGDTPFDGLFPSLVTDATNKATLKIYKAVDGVKLNAAQFFAERKQVAELFASTAARISSAVRSLKRADLRGFATSLSLSGSETRSFRQNWKRVERTPAHQRVSSHWLEYVYGWRPLLQDCHDAAELLAEQINTFKEPEGDLKTTSTVRAQYVYESAAPPGATGGVIISHRKEAHICTARVKLHYRLDSEARSLLNKTGISNPLLLAWELLPYSFVVDWFLPVGNYLQSLTAMDGFTITSGTISTLESAVSDRWITFIDHTGPSSAYGWDYISAKSEGANVACSQARYIRTPTTSFPYALRVKSPIGGEPLTRLTTAVALLTNLFRR